METTNSTHLRTLQEIERVDAVIRHVLATRRTIECDLDLFADDGKDDFSLIAAGGAGACKSVYGTLGDALFELGATEFLAPPETREELRERVLGVRIHLADGQQRLLGARDVLRRQANLMAVREDLEFLEVVALLDEIFDHLEELSDHLSRRYIAA